MTEFRKKILKILHPTSPLELKTICPGERGPQMTELQKISENYPYLPLPLIRKGPVQEKGIKITELRGGGKSGPALGDTSPSYATG